MLLERTDNLKLLVKGREAKNLKMGHSASPEASAVAWLFIELRRFGG